MYAPGGRVTSLDVSLEQNGQTPAAGLAGGAKGPSSSPPAADRVTVSGEIGRQTAPALKTGAATLVVHATRPVLFGLRQVSSTFRKDLQVRLTPPTMTVLSQFHFINQGGSEAVVYRVNPADSNPACASAK